MRKYARKPTIKSLKIGTLARIQATKLTNNNDIRKRLRKKMCYLYKVYDLVMTDRWWVVGDG